MGLLYQKNTNRPRPEIASPRSFCPDNMHPTPLNYISPTIVCLFVCIAAKPQVMGPGLTNERTLSAVPSRILINSSRCDTTPVANSCNQHFSLEGDITWAVTHPSTDCPDVASLLYSNRGNRCFNIVRPLALEFGLLRMVRQPSADTHVI
jgi:hypothetical protein